MPCPVCVSVCVSVRVQGGKGVSILQSQLELQAAGPKHGRRAGKVAASTAGEASPYEQKLRQPRIRSRNELPPAFAGASPLMSHRHAGRDGAGAVCSCVIVCVCVLCCLKHVMRCCQMNLVSVCYHHLMLHHCTRQHMMLLLADTNTSAKQHHSLISD
jgi:hypothetical protein